MYLVLFIATLCLLGIYIKDTSYVNYLHKHIDNLELSKYREKQMLVHLSSEQNNGMNEMKAGRYEESLEYFQNVKDEIERLANEEEPNDKV